MCIIIQAAVVVVFFLVLLVLALGFRSNHGRVVDGIDYAVCSASKLLNTPLGGEDSVGGFIGVLPMFGKFFWIGQQMRTNSPLMNDVGAIIEEDVQLYPEQLLYPLVGLVLLALLLVCCGCFSIACCATSIGDTAKPSIVAPRCAGFVLCFAFLNMFPVFRWVDVVDLVIMPSNMDCDVLISFDGNLLRTIAEGRHENTTSDSFVIGKDLIDACWAGTGPSSIWLDIVFLTENNSKVYLHQMMMTESTQPVDDAFKKITDTVASVNINLADNLAFIDMRSFIGSASAICLMFPSMHVIESDCTFAEFHTYITDLESRLQRSIARWRW